MQYRCIGYNRCTAHNFWKISIKYIEGISCPVEGGAWITGVWDKRGSTVFVKQKPGHLIELRGNRVTIININFVELMFLTKIYCMWVFLQVVTSLLSNLSLSWLQLHW